MGGWVGPRAGLNNLPLQNPSQIVHPVARRKYGLNYPGFPQSNHNIQYLKMQNIVSRFSPKQSFFMKMTTERQQLAYYPTGRISTTWSEVWCFQFFNWPNPSSCTVALGLTQPLTEMSTRQSFWGLLGRRLRLTTLPPSVSQFLENVGSSTSHNAMDRAYGYQGYFPQE
jgi:hypothetical protein